MENKPDKERTRKTRLAVAALLTGKPMKSRDISEVIREKTGRDIRMGTVSDMLSRISDPARCELGHFIQKSKEGNALVYTLVPEARTLSEARAYDLTLNRKKDRYSLEQALEEYPGLRKYCGTGKKSGFSGSPVLRVAKIPAEPSGALAGAGRLFRLRSEGNHPERTMELSLRYSDRYAVSVTASFTTFVLICCVLVLAFALCCFAVWSFLMPILIICILIFLLRNIRFFLKRKSENRS